MSDMEKDRMDIDREGIFDDDAVNEAAQIMLKRKLKK